LHKCFALQIKNSLTDRNTNYQVREFFYLFIWNLFSNLGEKYPELGIIIELFALKI